MALHTNDLIGDTSYRALMEETITVPALRVGPRSVTGEVIKVLYGSSFIRRGVRHCIDDEGASDSRICLLEPGVDVEALIAKVRAHFAALNGGAESVGAAAPSSCPASSSNAAASGEASTEGGDKQKEEKAAKKKQRQHAARQLTVLEATTRDVPFTYKNFTMPEILRKVLPAGIVALSGFEQVGHIAHVNLDESHLPHRFIIGQVILDCNETVRTVVNKLGSIDSVFREFKMECIGGEADAMTAEVKQYGITFVIPYDKVYWNSRLSFEHHRLVSEMNAGDELFDVMAGCGPFAIPAAQKGIIVRANDLNPESVKAMRTNADRNGLKLGDNDNEGAPAAIRCYEMDGRDFIERVVREKFLEVSASPAPVAASVVEAGRAYDRQFAVLSAADKKCGKRNGPTSSATVTEANNSAASASAAVYNGPRRHMSMNLPALAVDFLDVFTRPTWRTGRVLDRSMLIHVYTFSAAEDYLADAVVQCETNLKTSLAGGYVEKVTLVRDVAPNKQMVCVSFRLPPAIFGEEGPEAKKARAE